MKKTTAITLSVMLMLLIAFVGFIAFGILNSKEDDGKRESINGTEINWDLIIREESVPEVLLIEVNDLEVADAANYLIFIETFNGNPKLISDDKKNGYSKIHVEFTKISFIEMTHSRTKYDGKETTFYIKNSAIEELLKADLLVEDK